jgi:very-short-patch-repair endonuclease
MMSGLVEQWSLDWHYRSKDERLIAFANSYVYGNRLVTFPSAFEDPAISHVLVESSSPVDGQGDSPSAEVLRVVDLVLEHASTRSQESLGVIALGIKHANRIQAALDKARLDRPELDSFFDEQVGERFFVKNLERVQGDERDAIILSVGVDRLRGGGVDYRGFGPLNGDGGQRRLNVAITRARRRMTVVSRFTHHDMDPQRRGGTGMLRDYLQYARSEGRSFGDGQPTDVATNVFEADIAQALTDAGINVVPQWGASKYRIDLVAQHPDRPGQFVLAIECDGASYHAAPTARDRDRLRQQHLEALGWRFHRIWSTDWFQHRDQEIARARLAFDAAVRAADEPRTLAPSATQADETAPTPAVPARRGPRPAIVGREPIDTYATHELASLLEWIDSDGRLRTDDQLVEELFRELGYGRRGGRIMERLREIVRQRSRRGRTQDR